VQWEIAFRRVGGGERGLELQTDCAQRAISPPQGNAGRQSASILSACAMSGIPFARSGHALLTHFRAD